MCYERVDYGIEEEVRRLRSEEERAKRREVGAKEADQTEAEKDLELTRA